MVAIVEVVKWPTLIQSTNRLPCLRLIIFHPSQISDSKNGRNPPSICIQPGKPSIFSAPRRRRSVAHAYSPPIWRNNCRSSEACKFGASTLGFTAEDIQAFLRQRSAEVQQPTESKPPTIYHPAVLDPSLSKTTENSTFDLRTLAKDRFATSTKKNKERFDRLDRILDNNGLFTMARRTRICPTFVRNGPNNSLHQRIH